MTWVRRAPDLDSADAVVRPASTQTRRARRPKKTGGLERSRAPWPRSVSPLSVVVGKLDHARAGVLRPVPAPTIEPRRQVPSVSRSAERRKLVAHVDAVDECNISNKLRHSLTISTAPSRM